MPAPRQQQQQKAHITSAKSVGLAGVPKPINGSRDVRASGSSRRGGGPSSQQQRSGDGHQQPPWKSSLDVAWSYSRSQAHCPQQEGVTSPSFTERRWAGPSDNPSDSTDEEADEDIYDEYEGDSDSIDEREGAYAGEDEEQEDSLEEDLKEFGLPPPPSTERALSREGRHGSRQVASSSRFPSSSPPSSRRRRSDARHQSSSGYQRHDTTRSPNSAFRSIASGIATEGRLQDRQVSRLTQESRDTDERSRSRSRSPKRIAGSSNVCLPDCANGGGIGLGLGRRLADGGLSSRGRDSQRSREGGPRLRTSLSDFPRVGSHYERYSTRSSSRDYPEEERGSATGLGLGEPAIYGTDENTPLLLTLHRSKSVSPSMEGYGGGRSERGRSRSTLVVHGLPSAAAADECEERVRIPSLERSPVKNESAWRQLWRICVASSLGKASLPCCVGRRGGRE